MPRDLCHFLQGVPVIKEFEMLSMAIRRTRDFSCRHGGIVNSHDILGQREGGLKARLYYMIFMLYFCVYTGKKLDPMQKVIAYMKDREIRPTELFRSFDKEVSSSISHNNLIRRLKVGVYIV
eukprot:GHVO01051818.1.p2 GENE.GHVO01051818.1~~GHVO01051818.1.p2  ORF type:complete len:122 (+),score=4.33 GHVO01051818.1:648-1013(+)